MSLIRGDLEMGATGTVTHVDGTRVYAFGHPFLNLGPTAYPMTRAHVYTVLPSLDSSMKIATLGPVIGTMSQDRSTAVGGTLGAGPRELEVKVTLASDRAGERTFQFFVLHDQIAHAALQLRRASSTRWWPTNVRPARCRSRRAGRSRSAPTARCRSTTCSLATRRRRWRRRPSRRRSARRSPTSSAP